jgi:rhamnulokinase
MTADACGRTIVAGPVEATAIGNILVQAIGIGRVNSLPDAREIVRNSFEVKRYEPEAAKSWEAAAARHAQVTT